MDNKKKDTDKRSMIVRLEHYNNFARKNLQSQYKSEKVEKMSFADKLPALMRVNGFDRKSLAAAVGCSVEAIDKWRSGQMPSVRHQKTLAQIFNSPLAELFYDEQVKSRGDDDMSSATEILKAILGIHSRLDRIESRLDKLEHERPFLPKKNGGVI